MKWMILLLCFATLPHLVLAQKDKDTPEKWLGIGSGYRHYLVNDEIGSNLNYIGSGIPLVLNYISVSENNIQSAQLEYIQPVLSNHFNENKMEGLFMALQYSYWRRFPETNILGGQLALGGSFNVQGSRKKFNLRNQQTTGEIIVALNTSGLLFRKLGDKHLLTTGLEISMISYVLSREFNGSFTSELAIPGKIINYNFQFSYLYTLSRKVNSLLSYSFWYLELNRTNEVKTGTQQFLLGLTLKL